MCWTFTLSDRIPKSLSTLPNNQVDVWKHLTTHDEDTKVVQVLWKWGEYKGDRPCYKSLLRGIGKSRWKRNIGNNLSLVLLLRLLGFLYRSKLFIVWKLILKCFFRLDLKGVEGGVLSDRDPPLFRGNSAQKSLPLPCDLISSGFVSPYVLMGAQYFWCLSISKYGLGKPNFNHALLGSVGNSLKRLSRPARLAAADCSRWFIYSWCSQSLMPIQCLTAVAFMQRSLSWP